MIDAPAPAQGGLSSIREPFRFVNRHKIIIFVPTLLAAAIAWMIASKTVPRFEGTAALTLNVSKVHLVDREVVSSLPLESSTLRSELDIIRSRSLNEEVAVKLGLQSDPFILREVVTSESRWPTAFTRARRKLADSLPRIFEEDPAGASNAVPTVTSAQLVDWLVGNLKVSNDSRSLTIVVSFTSESPQWAATIANEVVQTYLDDQVLAKTRGTMKASDWLGQRVVKIRQDLEKSEAAVDDFKRSSGLLEVRGATIPAERLGGLNAELSNARVERMRAELRLQTAQKTDPENLLDVNSQTMQQLHIELERVNSEIAAERDYATYYKLKVLQDRADVVRTAMAREKKRILAGLAGEAEAARKKEAELAQSFQQMESQLGDAAHSGVRLMQLQREADANRSIYETFLARYKQAMEQESLAVPDARMISRAEPPGEPIYPNMLRFLLVGCVGGLAISGGLAFLREGFDRRIRQAADIETATGIPVYGLLPKVSRWGGLQPQDYPVSDPYSRFGTAFMRIHAALRAALSEERKQIILVTSAQSGDGKTSFCAGLARLLAQSRIRVLVIDADPYRSHVASAFGAKTFPAFDPPVERPIRLGDVVQTDAKSAAHFIPAPRREDLQLLLHSGGFEAILEEARQAYDVVIVDTPPVMASADAALIGKFADTRLLLVRWGRTAWDDMSAAIGFLRLCRVGLDGIVMIGVDRGATSYGRLSGYDTALSDNRFMRSFHGPQSQRQGVTEQ